jgi:hypothetical protein
MGVGGVWRGLGGVGGGGQGWGCVGACVGRVWCEFGGCGMVFEFPPTRPPPLEGSGGSGGVLWLCGCGGFGGWGAGWGVSGSVCGASGAVSTLKGVAWGLKL